MGVRRRFVADFGYLFELVVDGVGVHEQGLRGGF